MHSLAIDESIDINNDGLADLQYKIPIRKRPGLESAVYLNFLSSQESLNTSMFAVLPEQYSRGLYPSGIIGINPDGRFIVRKYEGQSATRSLVYGAQKGDYVLDSIEGKYQTIVSSVSTRNARSIDESELVDIADTGTTLSYKFTEDEFIDGYNKEALLSLLPLSIQTDTQAIISVLDKLNTILERKDLISIVAKTQETPIPPEIFAEVIAQVEFLNLDEVIQLNRVFLDAMYPESCPQFIDSYKGLSEILPLASLLFGGDTEANEPTGSSLNSRVASESEYNTQRAAMETAYGKYKTVFSKTLETPSYKDIKIVFNNSPVQI